MDQLGDLLRQSRQQLGLSLDEIEASTRIKRAYLEALEAENFQELPNQVTTRGFLRNYASALKLDVNYVLELYDKANQNKGVGRSPFERNRMHLKSIPMTPPSRFSPDLLIGFLLMTALLGIILYYVYQQHLLPLETILTSGPPSPTSQAALVLPTPTPAPTDTPTPTITPTPLFYTGVTVELVITEESWVQVLVDEAKAFEGILQTGEQRHWTGDSQVAVRAGNAGGVEVVVNGESMGLMGEPGQVVDQIWEKIEETPAAAPDQNNNTPSPSPTSP
ncbi:MAG: helix-turn-helix domain-containing protein [Anaerolineales bacterium]|nr:MAG: helix-turn-helix domain-containing protein [Anaerolineales bacterium]